MTRKIFTSIKRIGFLVSLTLLMSSFSPPEKTAKKIFKLMRSGQVHKIEKYYLEKQEFIDFVNGMERQPPKEQLDKMVQSYDQAMESHMDTFENIDVQDKRTLKIKRIEYDYQIGKPGKDEKIKWPESKDYNPVNTPSEQVKVNLTYFLYGDDKEYIMELEMMQYDGKWRLFHLLKPCSLYENQ